MHRDPRGQQTKKNMPKDKAPLRNGTDTLRKIVEGVAPVVGEEFFRSLVRSLSEALPVKCAYIGELLGDARMRFLAFWSGSHFIENFPCDLTLSPCAKILGGEIFHCAQGLLSQFPGDERLSELKIESCLIIPLMENKDKILGALAIFDDKPMEVQDEDLAIVKIFAGRACAELQRKLAEEAQERIERRLARILATAMDTIVTIDDQYRILIFNESAEKVFKCSEEEVLRQSFEQFLDPKFKELFEKYVASCARNQNDICYIWAPEGITARRATGEHFPIEATISLAVEEGQKYYTIILRDIEERISASVKIQTLLRETEYLREEISAEYNFDALIGQSTPFVRILDHVKKVAITDTAVLIVGETGTGKELIARKIHHLSQRSDRTLVKVNAAALPVNLVESEFFGHEKGAFTGAISRKLGRFELADGGTLFLDEIGDVSLDVQVKLLRVLQEQEFERVGGTETKKVDVRLIAATNRDLKKAMDENSFRADLFYRLNVFPIELPPLRDRKEDIPVLAYFFFNKHKSRLGNGCVNTISNETMEQLIRYEWPGNIRELSNVIERAVILSTSSTLRIEPANIRPRGEVAESFESAKLNDIEKAHILKVLGQTHWVISGSKGAAAVLDIHPNTLRNRMKKLGISRKGSVSETAD